VPLTDDQRAMLRLLAQREEGYEDIAALKGLSVEEVRAEVKDALAQLAAEEAPQAAPPEPPQPVEPPPAPKQEAEKPLPPTAPTPTPVAKTAGGSPRSPLPPERRRLLALTGGAVAVVAAVLAAIAIFDGGSDSGSAPTGGSATEAASGEAAKVTQAVLEPVDDGEASGRALFGKLGKEVVLQVTGEGLEPTAEGESYTVWLYRSPKLSLRVGSVGVAEDDDGQLGARFPIPAELLAYVAGGAFDQIYVSRTSDAAYRREVAQAKAQKRLPRYSGETVMTGEITGPIVKAAAGEGG